MVRLVQLLILAVCLISIECTHYLHGMNRMMRYPPYMMYGNMGMNGMMYPGMMYPGMMGYKEEDGPNDGTNPDGKVPSGLPDGVSSPDKIGVVSDGSADGEVPKGPREVRDTHLDEMKFAPPVVV